MTSAESKVKKLSMGPKFSMSLTDIGGKPMMPTSTPSPGTHGRLNPYSSLLEPQVQGSRTVELQRDDSYVATNASAVKAINKIIVKLPYDVRERVTSLVNMTLFSAENYQKQYEAAKLELLSLKGQYKRKIGEYQQLNQRCEIFREQIAMLEEKLGALEDDAESRQNYALRNQKAISRLSSTNKTLIDTFSLVGDGKPRKGSALDSARDKQRRRATTSATADGTGNSAASTPISGPQGRRRGTASSSSRPETPGKPIEEHASAASVLAHIAGVRGGSKPVGNDVDQEVPVTKNEKLREHMLRFAKEHNRVVKNVESLELTIQTLRSSLRYAERRNRQLQLELDEIRDNQSIDSGIAPDSPLKTGDKKSSASGKKEKKNAEGKKSAEKKSNGDGGGNPSGGTNPSSERVRRCVERMDTRLIELVNRNAFDPMEGIKQMDGIVEHLSRTPCNLVEAEVAMHLCSRRACALHDTERIAVFLLQPGGEFIHRYMTDSRTVDRIRVGEVESVAENVIRHGISKRYNNLKTSKNLYFNCDVDAGGDTNVKRVLCSPMREEGKKRIIGAIELINRVDGEKFSEVDELYNAVYGEMCGGLMSPCLLFRRVRDEAAIVTSIIQASLSLHHALPERETICASNPLDLGEVIYHAEVVFRGALQCAKVKVYIPGAVVDEASASFLSLESEAVSMRSMKRSLLSLRPTPIHSGIVGSVAQSKTPYLAANPPSDPHFNPQVDIDSPTQPFYCIPILDFNDRVIACVEAVPSPLSPPLQVHQDETDPCALSFENACQWLGFSLSANLANIIALIGKPSCRPNVQLHPITLTEKLCTVPLNLRPVKEYASKRRSHSEKSVKLIVAAGDAVTDFQVATQRSESDGTMFAEFNSFDNEDSLLKQDEYEQKIADMRLEIANLKAAGAGNASAEKAKREHELEVLRTQHQRDMAEQAQVIAQLQEQIAVLEGKVKAMECAEDASVLSGYLEISSIGIKNIRSGQCIRSLYKAYSLQKCSAHRKDLPLVFVILYMYGSSVCYRCSRQLDAVD